MPETVKFTMPVVLGAIASMLARKLAYEGGHLGWDMSMMKVHATDRDIEIVIPTSRPDAFFIMSIDLVADRASCTLHEPIKDGGPPEPTDDRIEGTILEVWKGYGGDSYPLPLTTV